MGVEFFSAFTRRGGEFDGVCDLIQDRESGFWNRLAPRLARGLLSSAEYEKRGPGNYDLGHNRLMCRTRKRQCMPQHSPTKDAAGNRKDPTAWARTTIAESVARVHEPHAIHGVSYRVRNPYRFTSIATARGKRMLFSR